MNLYAEGVYKWEDANGVVHYSSKSPSPDAKPAELPRIMRAEVKLTDMKIVSCSAHGGVNCQAGADADGSVICLDGFTGATQRYRFTCNAPKLSVTQITDLPEGGYSIFVRNSKSVTANSIGLFVRDEAGKELKLRGPGEIEGFGTGEFLLEKKDSEALKAKPSLDQVRLTCANCP